MIFFKQHCLFQSYADPKPSILSTNLLQTWSDKITAKFNSGIATTMITFIVEEQYMNDTEEDHGLSNIVCDFEEKCEDCLIVDSLSSKPRLDSVKLQQVFDFFKQFCLNDA